MPRRQLRDCRPGPIPGAIGSPPIDYQLKITLEGAYLEDDVRFGVKHLLMKPGDSVDYRYDLLDSWRHAVNRALAPPGLGRVQPRAFSNG